MEKKQKNSIVTFMMVVGVIFILTAGCIFVRQAWAYLPETVKHICLLGVALGSLAGSVLVGKSDVLRKTEAALFYIGDAFLGYFILSVTAGIMMSVSPGTNLALRLFIATLSMMVPVVFRLVNKQSVVDYGVSVGMANLAVIFALVGLESTLSAYVVSMAVMTLGLMMANFYVMKNDGFSQHVKICAKVCYLVQEVYTLCWMIIFSFLIELDILNASVNFAFVVIAFCIVLSALICYDKEEGTQIVQIIAACVLMGNMLLFNLLCGEISDALVLGIVALVIVIIAGIRNDKVFVAISSVTLLLIGFYITRTFWLSIAWWVYMFIAGVVMVLIAVKKEKEGE